MAASHKATSASARRCANDRGGRSPAGGVGRFAGVESPDHGRGRRRVEEPAEHTTTGGGRDVEVTTIEVRRRVTPREFIVGEFPPPTHHGHEIVRRHGLSRGQQRILMFRVLLGAAVRGGSQHLHVRDRHHPLGQRGRRHVMVTNQTRGTHQPDRHHTSDRRSFRQPRRGAGRTIVGPRRHRIPPTRAPHDLRRDPFLMGQQLQQAIRPGLRRPPRTILRRHERPTLAHPTHRIRHEHAPIKPRGYDTHPRLERPARVKGRVFAGLARLHLNVRGAGTNAGPLLAPLAGSRTEGTLHPEGRNCHNRAGG